MLTNKLRTILAALGSSESTENEPATTRKLSVIFMVAIAVRKFQKFESDKFKKSLIFNFDKQSALEKLKCELGGGGDGGLSLVKENFIKFAHYVRKFNLTFEDLNSIGLQIVQMCARILGDSSSDEKTAYFLALTLKYLSRNSAEETNPLEMTSIVGLIEQTVDSRALIKNELVALLVHRAEKLQYVDNGNKNAKLRLLIGNTAALSAETKALILGKLEQSSKQHAAGDDATQKEKAELTTTSRKSMAVRKVKKNQQVVSKTIQTVKAQHETKSSEEVDFEFLNLSECMRKRNARLNCNTVLEEIDSAERRAGSDQSIFNTTWAEVINLYSIVVASAVLKDDDKDAYLPGKFLGYHYFTTFWNKDAAKMYSFLINRMCTSIYAKITKRQQLNGKAIDGLMKCIVDFDSLVSLLDLEQDYVKMLVSIVFQNYWDLKKITSPDIVSNFFKNISRLTTEEYISRGWLYNSTEVKQIEYNRDSLRGIIRAEINNVRVDAIKALYNCALRDKKAVLTNKRVQTITKYAQRKDDDDQLFMDYIFKLMELAETLNDFNYADAFKTYLDHLNPKSTERLDYFLRFVTSQARDRARSLELFTDNVLARLIGLVGWGSCYNGKQKLDVLKIINICLEHEATKCLSEPNLQQLLDYCLQSGETSMINAGLTSLLLSTDKRRCFSQGTLSKLAESFDLMSDNEETTSYLVFILSRVYCADDDEATKKFYLNDQAIIESISSKMLCEHIIRPNDDDDETEQNIKFDKPSDENATSYSQNPSNKISSLSAKIIARSVEHKVKLSSDAIDNLLLVLLSNEGDKQTMIVAAKCLYSLTKYMSLGGGDNINQLLDLTNSPIYDVSVYCQAAYLRECVKVAYASECLNSIHLENISALYVSESLKLGQTDYEPEINSNLFKTLLYEARKQKFNDSNIFQLFNGICSLNGKYAPQVLRILVVYSEKYLVPEATVKTLENLLCVAGYFEQALLVLQKFVLGGGSPVTSKSLTVFADYLCSSVSSRERLNSFKLLERASEAQELPENTFNKLELVRAAYALECQTTDRQCVIKYIQSLTEKGVHLPADTKLALEKEISNAEVLKIFVNVSKQKQIIEQNLLNALIQLFNPLDTDATDSNKILISIFENAAKNNQTLPRPLLEKLETAFRLAELESSVLPLFIYLAQKGENLSPEVNEKLLNKLACEEDPVLKQELLSSLGSLIVAQQKEIKRYCSKINQILEKEITSDNFNIQKLCIAAIGKMCSVAKQLDDGLLEKLMQIGTDLNCNQTLRGEIERLFDFSIEDDCNPLIAKLHLREKIKLANLTGSSHRELLDQLSRYPGSELLVQNYKQLKEVLDNGDGSLQEETLNMLINYGFKGQLSDDLLESVAILYESTLSKKLSNLCLHLFNLTAESGKILAGRARQVWHSKLHKEENIKKFLQSNLCQQIQTDFQLDHGVILDVLQLIEDSSAKIEGVANLAEFIQLVVSERSGDYFNSPSFVLLLEGCLLQGRVLDVALPYYCRIIKEAKASKAQFCLQELVQYFLGNFSELTHLETRLFEGMYYANKVIQLPDICANFAICNLDSSNELVRGYSFGILRTLKDKHQYAKYAKTLSAFCDAMIESLMPNIKEKISITNKNYQDSVEIIVSVKFLDIAVFNKYKKNTWMQELMISSIFESFKVLPIDQINFYTSWSAVVDNFGYKKSREILLLIGRSSFAKFSQILELTMMIPELTFDEVIRMLTIYAPEPYVAFKQDWCKKKIIQAVTLSNKVNISAKYSSRQAEKLCSFLSVPYINKLFCCFKAIDNLSAFEGLIDFCSAENIDLNDVLKVEGANLNDVRRLIEANQLCSKCATTRPENEAEEKSFFKLYQSLHDAGWEFAQLRLLVTAFNPAEPFRRFKNLLHFLNTIQNYSLSASANFEKIKAILSNTKSFEQMIQKLNKLVVENHFQLEGKVKDLNELTAELKKTNAADSGLVNFIDAGYLDIRKLIFSDQAEKLNWNEKQIYIWAKEIRAKGGEFTDNEAIAIILRANFLVTGHTLTDTQILSSLIALRRGGNPKGKLLQIATGEGKSTIICILAIISALRGKNVHVITSSPVLASRDAKSKAKLYRMFNLTCSDNADKTVYIKGEKDCYKADIVYGEMAQFQFDILRDNYSKLGTLCGRQFQMAIVDEVDSMLIDDSSKIARLSSTVPGMDHFQALYVFIWQRLLAIKERFIMFKGTMYFVYGKVDFQDGLICLEVADQNGYIVKIPDLEQYLLSGNDVSQVADIVGDDIDDIDKYLSKSLESYLDDQIKENRIYIPSNFKNFLQRQKSKWIANAVEALNYQENVHYVVQDGEIKPVDYFSTGIVQSATSWSDGLHQFLQIKHNLKMTSETLTTNFLSNIGYMNKYEKVCGVTGTLGSETARTVFREVYLVDLINIPQRRQKQYLELESVVAQGEADWLKEITSNIMLEITKDRGILVICETIEHANRISVLLQKTLRSSAVKLYTLNDLDQEENVEKISPGEVIIATNLAGRGTDIQTDEIEATGGLHVILTYLPSNERVEGQAFGRTARQGKRGTGLMILNAHNLIDYNQNGPKSSMKAERDKTESKQLRHFKEVDLKLIQVKDKLFDIFCSFLNDEIRLTIRKDASNASKCANYIKSYFTDVQPTVYEVCALAAVEEQWAEFLSKLDDGTIKCENAEEECRALINQLRVDFRRNNFIKNPYHYVTIANDILVNSWTLTNASKAREALEYFKKAIELDGQKKGEEEEEDEEEEDEEDEEEDEDEEEEEKVKEVEKSKLNSSGAAHLGIAWCLILQREENYKTNALLSLQTALKCLSNEMSVLNATQLLLDQKQPGFAHDSPLYKQLIVKATILGSYLSGISTSIEALKRSKRLIDLVAVTKHSEKGNILETIAHFNELERDENNKSSFLNKDCKLNDKQSYSLTFNHLTVRDDSGPIDQAYWTLNNAFDKNLLKKCESESSTKLKALKNKYMSSEYSCLDAKSYRNVCLNLKSIDLAKVNSALFNPDKEFKELTREMAIATFKSERSYWHALRLSNSHEVSLTIRSNDKRQINKRHESNQINELIKVVEETKIGDETLRFDIVIKRANENAINKLFASSGVESLSSLVHLNVEFNSLNQETAEAKLSSIKAPFCDVEFALNKSDLLKVIKCNQTLECGKLFVNESVFQTVKKDEILKRVGELKTDETLCNVKFEKLTIDQAQKLVKSCPANVLFALSFIDIKHFYRTLGREEGQVNFSFDKLAQDTASMFIEVLRNEKIEFSLEFKNLSKKEVKFILKNADLEQEAVVIQQVKNIRDLYATGTSPTQELNDFISKGIEYILEMMERQFVPWKSVCAVAALGVGQMILGGVLIATGFGASAGMGLVTEGLADIFTAYRAYSNRQFQWSDYAKQKAVSLALSVATMGYSKWKEGAQGAAKGIQTLTTGASKELLEQAGTQLISNRKIVGQTLIATGKNLKGLALKFVATKATEAVARETLNAGFKCLSDFSFNALKPHICETVQSRVRQSFINSELLGFLRKMQAIDLVTNSRQLQPKVDSIVAETVNPRHDFMRRQWDSIGLPLIKGVLSDSSRYGSVASLTIRFTSILSGLHQVQTLTNNVADALVTKLKVVDRNSMTISCLLHQCLKMKKDRVQVIVSQFSQHGIFDGNGNFQLSSLKTEEANNCDLKAKIDSFSLYWSQNRKAVLKELGSDENDSKMVEDVGRSIVFVEGLIAKYVAIDFDSFSVIIGSVSSQIADQMIRIIDSQMVQPVTTYVTSSLVDAASKRIQNALVNRDQNSDSHKADQEKYDKLLQKKDGLSPDEAAFMANYGKFRTFGEQINYNSRDHCDAYSQCEMAYHAGKNDASNSSSLADVSQVKETAENVRNGSPANIGVMIATATANGVKLKVVDDPQYERTQEDIDNEVQVIYVKPGDDGGIGHAYYMDSKGRFAEAEQTAGSADCFFAAFSKILEQTGVSKSADQLRTEAAKQIESNPGNFSKVLSAENYIRTAHPDSANNLMFTAGLRKGVDKSGKPWIFVEDDDIAKIKKAINNKEDDINELLNYLKDLVPPEKTNDLTTKALHHIISQMRIKESVTNSIREDKDEFKNSLEQFLNNENNKNIIGSILDESTKNPNSENSLKKDDHGRLVKTAILWNPNNLVRGPEKRNDDPKSKLDKKILNEQPTDVQEAVKSAINADGTTVNLSKFFEIPPSSPVEWEEKSDGTYVVKKQPKQKPADQ